MEFKLPEYRRPDFSRQKFIDAPNVEHRAVQKDGVAPENYHATSIFPEYYKIDGEWILAGETRMDCVVVIRGAKELEVVEFRNLKAGDEVILGRTENCEDGIFLHSTGFDETDSANKDVFAFRSGRSRETAFSKDYDSLYHMLLHERAHGNILWVMGPAFAFDADARAAMAELIEMGFVNGILAGNALATHDLEAAYVGTALGQDIYTQVSRPNGHYNHLDTINAVKRSGSIPRFIEDNAIGSGIIYTMVKKGIPFVLTGSIRDDGPLPEIYRDNYQGQDAMRALVRKATTVICLATQLHTIATGNMTPCFRMVDGKIRPLYIYSVDISEFALNKLSDRGSLTATSIVTNVQDFIVMVRNGVKRLEAESAQNV